MFNNLSDLWVIIPNSIIIYGFVLIVTFSQTISLVIVGLLLVMLICFRIRPLDRSAADEMLQAGKVSVIAHRGGATDAPENTIGAIRKAKQNGADGVEFDVSYTSDGVAVLMHDDSVDRTTDGTGDISSLSWAHVQTLNAASNKAAKPGFDYEKVPSLEEAVQVCLNLGLYMYIDCKADAKRTAAVMSALYKKYPEMYKTALVCSFYPQVVYLVRRADPRIVTALIHRPMYLSQLQAGEWRPHPWWQLAVLATLDFLTIWAQSAFLWYLCGNSAFSMLKDGCNRHVVEFFQSRGVQILLWTVNDPDEKAYFTRVLGCDIITDTLLNTKPEDSVPTNTTKVSNNSTIQ